MPTVREDDAMDARIILALSEIPGVGAGRLRSLLDHFKDPRAIVQATARELVAVEGIEKRTALAVTGFCRDGRYAQALGLADDQIARMNRAGARMVTIREKDYPSNMKRIFDHPPYLFVQGCLEENDNVSIAIVGTRDPSPYGIQMAERFTTGLVALGLPIVSGLARGVDTVAHSTAVRGRGRTIAVIGSGIDKMYPPENKPLAERIARTGAVLSEFLMGTKPDAGNFPRRNRIISGIALATLVVETGVHGGAMITASTAFDQNREVFAIPSAVNTRSPSGTNLLIKQGKAILAETVDDIVAELAPRLKGVVRDVRHSRPRPVDLTLFEHRIAEAMGDEPLHIDLLAEKAGLSTSDTLVSLLSLEFKGVVRQMPGKMFVKM